jgi:hypothetical protein
VPPSPGHELLQSATAQLDRAAKAINLDPGMHRHLEEVEKRLEICMRRAMELVLAKARATIPRCVRRRSFVAIERVASAITKRGRLP